MGAEAAFLDAIADYLGTVPLTPVPDTIGPAEPENAGQLPAVALWLEETRSAGNGLGERSELVTDGVLPVQARIDLANPVLPEDPSFRLLSSDRTVLTLPHGGQVRADGSPATGPLTPADLTVTVGATAREVVTGTPTGGRVRGDPILGQLTFGSPLPATGLVIATYFLGQWERRTSRIAGVLVADVFGADAQEVGTLTTGVTDALQLSRARAAVRVLHALSLVGLSSIAPKVGPARKRSARFSFVFEHEINQPDSSGGIIRQIPVTSRLSVVRVDAAGAEQTEIVTEP